MLAALLLLVGLSPLLLVVYLRRHVRGVLRSGRRRIGFFHPQPLAGGGGERVLWVAVLAARRRLPEADVIVYGHFGGLRGDGVARLVESQFGLKVADAGYSAVELSAAEVDVVRASRYPRMTLLLQALGAAWLGAMAYLRRPSHVLIESANYTFALVPAWVLGARTAAYVHYPIVSADMLALVRGRSAAFNNAATIARSPLLSAVKGVYYHAFALLYAIVARCVHRPVANSSWTAAHLEAVWHRRAGSMRIAFPPCATLLQAPANVKRDPALVLSVAQYRPEKLHHLQLDTFEALQKAHPDHGLRLIAVGGARGPADAARAAALRQRAAERGLPVEVRINASNDELEQLLARASIGLHTMRDEHFGISVVNMQAAGLLVVAHGSGGVASDIVRDGKSGLLAYSGADEFADCLWKAKKMVGTAAGEQMVSEAVKDAGRFSNKAFEDEFGKVISEVAALP